jgi:hypothetical protein
MTRKDVRTVHDAVACDVCGRTLLRGEHPEAYLAGAARRQVCELCTARAAHQGWIRESAALVVTSASRDRPDRRPLRGRLLSRIARELRAPEPAEPEPADALAEEPVAEPPADSRRFDPHHHVHAVPTNGEMKAARAVDLFNASDHPRTVAGVARSLGAPGVTVRPGDDTSIVGIVVAWELCWYRYEVDLAEGPAAVRVAEQGYELEELTPEDQEANAAADDRGGLALVGGGPTTR